MNKTIEMSVWDWEAIVMYLEYFSRELALPDIKDNVEYTLNKLRSQLDEI